MNRIRNLTLFAVGWGLLLSTVIFAASLDAAVDGVSGQSASAEDVVGNDSHVRSESDHSAGSANSADGREWAVFSWALWPLGFVEFWLCVWSLALLVAPKLILDADASLRRVKVGRLPFSGGARVTLSHLTFVRAFAQHSRVMDEWVNSHAQAINDWLSIENRDSTAKEQELLIRVDGQALSVADAPTVRAMLPETPFLLALHGQGRRWGEQVLSIVFRQAMHPDRANRMLIHRTIPIVLDRNCVERLQASKVADSAPGTPLWLRVVRHELCRVPGVASSLDNSLLKCLVQSRRILPVADQWSRTPKAFQNALQMAVSTAELPCLVVLDDDDSVAEMNGVVRARSLDTPQIQSSIADKKSQNPDHAARTTPVAPRGFDAGSVPMLIRSLTDPVAEVRQAAAHALGGLGAAASSASQELTGLLSDSVTSCRQAAADALGAIGPAAAGATAVLAGIATKDHRMVRAAACRALGAIGRPDKGAMSALVDALQDGDSSVRSQAARSLGSIGAADPEVTSALKAALDDDFADVRRRVVAAISGIPAALHELLTKLMAAVADPAVEVRREVVMALGRTEHAREMVVKTLTCSLSDPDAQTRSRAAESLSNFGLDSRAAVPQLARLVHDSVVEVRRNAVVALNSIGVRNLESVSAIEEATRDTDEVVRFAARSALERLIPTSAAA